MRYGFRILLTALVAASIVPVVVGCSDNPQQIIDQMAADIRDELPKKLDDDTRLVNVYTKRLELVSEYELINYNPAQADAPLVRKRIEAYLKQHTCPDIKKVLLDKGISSRYRYMANNGEIVLDLVLSPGDC